jgi:hypothetical protein
MNLIIKRNNMKIRYFTMLLVMSFWLFARLGAQTAEEIINKHIEAIGGAGKLTAIKTVYSEGAVAIPSSVLGEGRSKTYRVNGEGLRDEMIFGTYDIIESYTARQGWWLQPFLGKAKPDTLSEQRTKAGQAQLFIGGPLLNYKASGSTVELLGKENINGTDAFKLKLLTKDGIEFTYLVDPATYYILRSTVRLKNGEHLKTTSFSDYRKTDEGLVMPFAAEFTTGNSNLMYLIVNKVEINKDIDPEVFKMPK